jgi:hypothetical protein
MDDPKYRLIDTLDDEFSIFQDVFGNYNLWIRSFYQNPSLLHTQLLSIMFVNRKPKFIQIGEECIIDNSKTDRGLKFAFSGDLIHIDYNNKILQRYRYTNGKLTRFYLSDFKQNYDAKWNMQKLPAMLKNGKSEHCPVFYECSNGKCQYYPEYSDPLIFSQF